MWWRVGSDSLPDAGAMAEARTKVIERLHAREVAKPPAFVHPRPRMSLVQRSWLIHGLTQPGSKLSLFDRFGRRVSSRTIQSCIDQGWAEPWFSNPIKPDWQICRLTEKGRKALEHR
jgi:hypothetical protein